MPKMSGGEALVQSLIREGVEVVFGIPGIHMNGIVAAMRDEPAIRLVTTRHEQGAAHMADGYARASGKPGVVLVVPGTGVYNAAAGLATAYARSSPVLLIAGQIPRGQIGKNLGAIHEILDQGGTLAPVTKWRRQVLTPRDVPAAVSEASRQMRTGRPRPGLIEMPPETGVERDEVLLRKLNDDCQGRLATATAEERVLLRYYQSNTYAAIIASNHGNADYTWSWKQPEAIQNILLLRHAIREPAFGTVDPVVAS